MSDIHQTCWVKNYTMRFDMAGQSLYKLFRCTTLLPFAPASLTAHPRKP